jgi:non-ribosomal peptide synthase protein (TIGR01720 family)
VKERLREMARHGLGYGLLHHLAGTVGPSPAQVSFNYLGHTTPATPPSAADEATGVGEAAGVWFQAAGGSLGEDRSPDGERAYLIDITGHVVGGELHLAWNYSANIHDQATITALAHGYITALTELIDHCCTPGTGSYTPSDFPLAHLTQDILDTIQQRLTTTPPPAVLPDWEVDR